MNVDRIFDLTNQVGEVSASETGCSRFSYSEEDREVRNIFMREFEMLGLDISVDPAGNIHARYSPDIVRHESSILIGSHVDTVPHGGRYDGVLGVVVALEAVRTIIEKQIAVARPIEVIIYAEEEGSNFGVTSLGSKLMTKQLSFKDLENLKAFDGTPAVTVMKNMGLQPETIDEYEPEAVFACLELHIEQGPVLDRKGYSVGIVESIVGQRIYHVLVSGESNHAGTTPMNYRKDALVCASSIIHRIPMLLKSYGGKNTVATVGKVNVIPNGANVIASEVNFWIDVRDTDDEMMNRFADELNTFIGTLAEKHHCKAGMSLVSSSSPTVFSADIVRCMKRAADDSGLEYIVLSSGAGHDSGVMNMVAPTAMIFVKSINGVSHSPMESVNVYDVAAGASLLLESVIRLANGDAILSC